ncbi:MAG: helix-turn-helix domain-containing protein [Ruminococcus sp.]|nr:helix-turn-helix domain-containing protein [Ruminococcus sp.]
MDAKTTGKFICRLRKEKDLTQVMLAEKLNISNRTVSKWENGDGFPDITILPELSKILGVSADELLTGEKIKRADKKDNAPDNKPATNNLDNFFQITYVVALFIGAFSALLGGVTEFYSIWAFRILFYTHWEIMFAAVSLFSLVASGLIFSVGVTRLKISYSIAEIRARVIKKIWLLSLILSIFPVSFILRLIDCFLPMINVWLIAIAFAVILALVFTLAYKKISD